MHLHPERRVSPLCSLNLFDDLKRQIGQVTASAAIGIGPGNTVSMKGEEKQQIGASFNGITPTCHRELTAVVRAALRRGTLPRLGTVERLRLGARLTLGSMYSILGIDLDRLTWLRAHVNINRTRPAPSHAYLQGTPIWMPAILQGGEKPYRTAPLSKIIKQWRQQPLSSLARWSRRKCLYAQIGLHDGMSYPVIPPGAFIQIDPSSITVNGISDQNYYFVRHPYGYSCCRCVIDRGVIFLLPSSRLYPQLEFPHPGIVQILGRVRGFCARIDNIISPPSSTLSQILDRRIKMVRTPAELENTCTGSELLLNQRLCLGIPYQELNCATVTIREVSDEFARFHITNGHAHKIEHEPDFIPTIPTLCALSAYYAIDYAELMCSYGFSTSDKGMLDLSSRDLRLEDSEHVFPPDADSMQDEFSQFVLERWLELPPLLAHILCDLPSRTLFFFGGNSGIEPILKPGAFLLVDESQTIKNIDSGGTTSDWERPLYLLYTREDGFIVHYAERHGKRITLIPHCRANDQRQKTLLCPEEVDVIGRITGVATLL